VAAGRTEQARAVVDTLAKGLTGRDAPLARAALVACGLKNWQTGLRQRIPSPTFFAPRVPQAGHFMLPVRASISDLRNPILSL